MNNFEWIQLTKALDALDRGDLQTTRDNLANVLAIKNSQNNERNQNKWAQPYKTQPTSHATAGGDSTKTKCSA